MKGGLGCLSILVGVLLVAVGLYVHYTTIADIPAASMTLRLQWSGWEWFVPGLVLFFGGFKLMPDDNEKSK
jgi:hypothetical protein